LVTELTRIVPVFTLLSHRSLLWPG